ncbi:MAG: MATE family efflux transporter [Clostridiales bacterium]|nr:MATE family efflux transporter [Clostridiales bacterium]
MALFSKKEKAPHNFMLKDHPTKREIRWDIFRMAWPSALEMILVSLCGIVDMMMVGDLGSYAITAIGLTNQPKFLILALFQALNVGCTALVARSRGEGRQDTANTATSSNLIISIILSIVLSTIAYFFVYNLVGIMGGDAQATYYGALYFKYILIGMPFNIAGMAITAALRGVGNTKASLYMNMTANLVNVFFNYCLIYGNLGFPQLGVAGAAIATSLGFVIAFFMGLFILLRKKQYVYLSREHKSIDKEVVRRMLRVGTPTMVEQLGMRVGQFIFTRIVAGLGTVAFAAHTITINIESLSFTTGQAFGVASTTFVGQNLGRKRPDLAEEYARETNKVGFAVAVLIGLLLFTFAHPIVGLYANEAEVIALTAQVLTFVSLTQPIQCYYFVTASSLRGAGDTRYTAMVLLISMMILRPSLAFLFVIVMNFGVMGAWFGITLEQCFRAVMVFFRFRSGKWKLMKV